MILAPARRSNWVLDPFSDPSSIAHNLDFSFGHRIRAQVRQLFASPVNPVSSLHRFFLVVSFGCASFRLDDLNVSIALSACLGAAYDSLWIHHLNGRVFKFVVANKNVGFFINNLRSFSC